VIHKAAVDHPVQVDLVGQVAALQVPVLQRVQAGRVNADAIARAQDWFHQHGYVQTKVDLAKVIDHQFADYAVAELGPYQP
jgi:hypothetical protein